MRKTMKPATQRSLSWIRMSRAGPSALEIGVDSVPLNLPVLFEDETLYSWAGAVHGRNPNPTPRDTSVQLFGTHHAAFLHDFPANLALLDASTQHCLGNTDDLALHHTLLGYFLPAKPKDVAETLLAAINGGSARHIRFQLGIPSSQLGANHPLKGCPECFSRTISCSRPRRLFDLRRRKEGGSDDHHRRSLGDYPRDSIYSSNEDTLLSEA